MIITIDGHIATGKSTIAKALSRAIGYIYFDTGAMYRCLTYALIKHNIDPDDDNAIIVFLNEFQFDIKIKQGERFYYVDSEDVSKEIRLPTVTSLVSKVSAKGPVREKLVTMQRDFSKGVNAVFEGRDMGTVVFPDAELKIFLIGRLEVRAQRRYDELKSKYPDEMQALTIDQMKEEITQRDLYDSTREISPLKKAEDAYLIDTSDMTIDEIVYKILEYKETMRTIHD